MRLKRVLIPAFSCRSYFVLLRERHFFQNHAHLLREKHLFQNRTHHLLRRIGIYQIDAYFWPSECFPDDLIRAVLINPCFMPQMMRSILKNVDYREHERVVLKKAEFLPPRGFEKSAFLDGHP